MNINENVPMLGRGKARQLKVVPIQRILMGPPTGPAPKRKESSTAAYTTNSSSNINWRQNQKSTQNNSTTVRTSSSLRSHSTTEPELRIVIALSEGRGEAVGEVGIAAINIARPSLILCQISDSQSYINTLTKINILNPSEILVPLTFIESFTSNRLVEKVKEQFRDIKITGVTRSTFNKSTGLQYVKQLCMPSMNSILLILQHRYYALAAAAALLTYTETALYVTYARESIKIEYQESEGSTIIDVATADRLELVASARPTMKKRFSCLLDVLNHCLTKIGARTLRASILQPPCSVPEIEARLDCVTELVQHSDMLAAIQVLFSKLTNIDQLLTLATVLPDRAQNCSERQINYILLLNTVLEQISPLRDVFENSTQPFFIELRATLGNPAFTEIRNLIRTLIHTDAHPGKGQYGMYQRCFAIKSGINSLLDLVRKSYSERLDDMRKYVTTLGERYSLAMTLHNSHKKGYHILLNLNAQQKKTLKKNDLPPECIQVERLTNSYTMKTQDLINLSNRVEDIMAEILKMSNIMIHKLLIQIREHMGIFYKLCEEIAKLDMFQSLAKASCAIQYVRPQFASYLEVRQARHPLLDFLCSTEPSANSMYASKEHNINIITGPNGSGKSIFVRQVILIQVMAQVGCYVPAQSAILRVSDRILARVYLEDNMDCGASAFVLEMKEIQYFLTVLTKNSLIIIDELCRSTSVEEGTALAMAVCEKLMQTSAFVFFTTHFKFLTKLQDLHFSVKTWQLETLTETIDNQMVLRFTYNVIPGVTSLEHYGIFLAKGSWPEIIINYAEEILKKLSTSHKQPAPHVQAVSTAARLKYDLEAELQMLKAKKELTRTKINEKLVEYQRNLEGLGHQVEIVLLSDQADNNNPLPLYENENYNALSGNQTGEFFNYFNLQRQSQNIDIDNVSHNLNQGMVSPLKQNFSTKQNINIFENIHEENQELLPFFNFQDIESFDQETFYPTTKFPSSVQQHPSEELYFKTNQASVALREYYNSFSDNPISLNNSAISERIAQLHVSERNESLNHSFSNVFEPEVILETDEDLMVNFSNVQNLPMQQKSFVLHKKSTDVNQHATYLSRENIFMTSFERDTSLPLDHSYTSKENSYLSREFVVSRSASIVPRENFVPSAREFVVSRSDTIASRQNFIDSITPRRHVICSQESGSIYEDAMSEYFTNDWQSINTAYDNYRRQTINPNESKRNESFLSITEQQFSLPLQQGIERTSTPVNLTRTSPPPIWNQIHLSNLSPKTYKLDRPKFKDSPCHTPKATSFSGTTEKTNATQCVVVSSNTVDKSIINEERPKTDSTKSDSIKWVAPNQINTFTTPLALKTAIPNDPFCSINSNATQFKINQMTVDKNKQSNTSSKTSTDSIVQVVDEKVARSKCDLEKSAHNVSNSRYYSEADLADILNDLQSCSEYFSESQDWDFVDEEVNLKLNQQTSNKSDQTRTPSATESTIENENMQIDQLECEYKFQQNSPKRERATEAHTECVLVESADPSLPKQLESNRAGDGHGQQGRKRKSVIQRKKKVPTKNVFIRTHKKILKAKDVKTCVCTKRKMCQSRNKMRSNNRGSSKPYDTEKNIETVCSRIDHPPCETSQLSYNKEVDQILNNNKSPDSQKDTINGAIHQHDWNERNIHAQNEETPCPQLDAQKNPETKISDPQDHEETSQRNPKITYHEKIHETSYHQGIEYSQCTETLQSKSIEKPSQLQGKEIHRFPCDSQPIHEPQNCPQLEYIKQTIQLQSFSEMQQLEDREELHEFKFGKESDHNELTPSKCNKETSQTEHECDSSATRTGENAHDDENVIPLDDKKKLEYPESTGTKNTDHNIHGSINVPILYQTKLKPTNESCTSILNKEHSQGEHTETNKSNPKTDDTADPHSKGIMIRNISLEPLGDIHLELFSDESIYEEFQNCSLNKSPNEECKRYGEALSSPIDDGRSTAPKDCNNAVSEQSILSPVFQINVTTDEYETAHSGLAISQQNNIFFNTPCSTGPAFTSTPNDKKRQQLESLQPDGVLSQTSKRKKLGYTTKTANKSNWKNPLCLSPIPRTATEPTVTRETSPDIFEESPQEIYPLYKNPSEEASRTSSDFENSKTIKPCQRAKKSKWVPPLKNNSNNEEQRKVPQKMKQYKSKIPKFKPPCKLTKKEIELDFYEQDKKMLESGNSSQYLEQIINRPTVRQLQQAKHIASIRKTSTGIVVVPAKESKPKKKKSKFVTPLKRRSEDFDVTLFSDRNSDKFDQFMNNGNGKKTTTMRQDVVNQFIESEVVVKEDKKNLSGKNPEQNSSANVCKKVLKHKVEILQDVKLVSASNVNEEIGTTKRRKEGYYTQNKKRIDNIVNKYLTSNLEHISTANVSSNSKKNQSQEYNSSCFSQTTVILDID